MNEEEKQWVLDNVDSINADVNDIDELCCALEHSTIFAVDYIQTFATKLIDFEFKYNNLQQELDQYKNNREELKKCINHYAIDEEDGSKIYSVEEIELLEILDKMEELEEGK